MTPEKRPIEETIREHLQKGDGVGWFEPFYADAQGDAARIPWAGAGPRKDLLRWANTRNATGRGQSALVIGCGLGDDAEFLAGLGYQVTAFDVSATAIEWCQQRFPDSTVAYQAADMFAPPIAWLGGFDFVLENYIVQALPVEMRPDTVAAVAAFPTAGGLLLAIGMGIDDASLRSGPPWPLTGDDLALFEVAGLERVDFRRDDDPEMAPRHRYWAEFRRK